MVTAVIIDEIERSRQALKNRLLSFCKGVKVLALADSVPAGVKAIQQYHPDLIFLDIQMPFNNGFELFKFLPALSAGVVFTNARDQYSLQAFKVSEANYLLQPIDLEELKKSLYPASEMMPSSQNWFQQQAPIPLPKPARKLCLPVSDGYLYIKRDELVRCEADSNYTRFFIKGGEKILVPKTLKEYENELSNGNFMRVHRSHIININFVKKYTRTRIPKVTMEDGSTISISLKMKDILLERLAQI